MRTASNIALAILAALLIGRYFYLKPRYGRGDVAPDIAATLWNGDSFRLSGLRGNYVLLEFWGSWCGPCRDKNAGLSRLHEKYRGYRFAEAQGFEIVSVAIEPDEGRWKQAIRQDRLRWKYHLLDTTVSRKFFDGPLARQYKIVRLPTSYLLDERGLVGGVDLPVEEVDRWLAERVRE